jgi:DNA-binding winged helix-turn-helix (wHTH) protein
VKYRFGNIQLDVDARSITSAAAPVHLTRKAFDLLILLLEQGPSAVTKDQIYARLWPDTFVTESSIQTLVREIRQMLDEPGSPHSWIRTVHGIGYSFAGDAVVTDAPPTPARSERPAAWLLGESTRVALHAGENILGRGVDDVIEVDLPTISRRHARITIGESATLEDLGSKNGTWLEDERVTAPRTLADGDVVGLGSARFTFRLARSPRSTESTEMPRHHE